MWSQIWEFFPNWSSNIHDTAVWEGKNDHKQDGWLSILITQSSVWIPDCRGSSPPPLSLWVKQYLDMWDALTAEQFLCFTVPLHPHRAAPVSCRLKPLITVPSSSSLHSSSFLFLLFEQKQWIKSCLYLMCPLAPQTQHTDTHHQWLALNWFHTPVMPRPGYNRNWKQL